VKDSAEGSDPPVVGMSLPMAGPPPERADAARNRQLLVAAAQRLLEAGGTTGLTMDAVAREAGVGVGTAYRRFGDLAGLALELLSDHEAELQTAFLSGPPPLGPGAPPVARIRAFLLALVERTERHIDLLVLAESLKHGGRFSAAYAAEHAHLRGLLDQACPHVDTVYLADVLLAPLAPSLYLHQRGGRGMDPSRIREGFEQFLELLELGSPD
jgi:AcrR family transcriptional regulator